jgi:AcrR family transcriptional regulator
MVPSTRGNLASLRSRTRRGRSVDDSRRDELLHRLQDLVLSEGFAKLTVDDLAARLHCSKSTLYAISSSKEHLVTTVIKHFFADAAATVEQRVSTITDPSERIASYLRAVGAAMRRMSSACYQDMVTHDSTREIYAINSLAAARRVRGLIHEGVAAGTFRAVHAEFLAESVSLLIDGIQHGELLDRTGMSSGDAYAELSDLVLAALVSSHRRTA